ncbi:MAG: response regulator [Candidatus Obscuribacterales bacterium]|nr:response regulator [Candidatus Obscuribacterales bacterium]
MSSAPNRKLLLVDDDENIRFVAELSLEADWQISSASSGSRALEIAVAENPDVILLDMMMPGMTGAEVFAKLRQIDLTRKTPVIFMTAKVQKEEVAQYMAMGVNGVILKPFDPMSLSEEIGQMLGNSVCA